MGQEAIRMSLQDEEEKDLQRAIALSMAEAEIKNKANSTFVLMDDTSNKSVLLQKSKPPVHEDLIDIGQHDLLDLAEPAPASAPVFPATEKELFDVFPTVTLAA